MVCHLVCFQIRFGRLCAAERHSTAAKVESGHLAQAARNRFAQKEIERQNQF